MSGEIRPESENVPGGWTAGVIVALVAFAWLCAGAIWWLYPQIRQPDPRMPTAFTAPGLEVAPVEDFETYMAHQRALLAGAGGRTPIDAAMATVAERGTLTPEAVP